jgi:hypothetical protein
MNAFPRHLVFSASYLALLLAALPAQAACDCRQNAPTHHHHIVHHAVIHHTVTHHARHHGKAAAITSGTQVVRVAQQHLANLGYYGGRIDGLMGPQTKAAIKRFQYDKRLAVDGILGPQTRAALEAADQRVIGTQSVPLQNIVIGPDANVNADYVAPLNGGTEILSSRFARINVSESGHGADKRYAVTLNDQPLLNVDGQPSIIGISQTYSIGDEDMIVFSTYNAGDTLCTYKTHVLALTASGNQMIDIGNCTRAYQARVDDDSLYLAFPEQDDNRAVGATWRVEGMTAERL